VHKYSSEYGLLFLNTKTKKHKNLKYYNNNVIPSVILVLDRKFGILYLLLKKIDNVKKNIKIDIYLFRNITLFREKKSVFLLIKKLKNTKI
jgi:hypothetical protein